MFSTLFFVVVPALLVFLGTVAALSFANPPSGSEEKTQAQIPLQTMTGVGSIRQEPTLFRPLPKSRLREDLVIEDLSVNELLSMIEAHLKEESRAAKAFSSNPSAYTLWLN